MPFTFYLVASLVLWSVLLVLTSMALLLLACLQFANIRRKRNEFHTKGAFTQFLKAHHTGKRIIKIATGLTFAIVISAFCAASFFAWRGTLHLREQIEHSSRLTVRTGGNCHRDSKREKTLFQTDDPKEILSLTKCLAFGLSAGEQCMCCGDMTFDLFDKDHLLCSFSLHHYERIRIEGAPFGDRKLTASSKRNLNDWLEKRNILRKSHKIQSQVNTPTADR
ncbi:MAG: hypothetical protein PHV34_20220 [Verrucomicrobiae bacterium]|nr:hypothetical protein [Verrucomicrobiae bacterium]